MNPSSKSFDWQRAHEALERAGRRLAEIDEPSEAAATRVLERRAAALARPHAEADAAGETLDLLVFSVAGERYGVDARDVEDVLRLPEPIPVPFTPPAVLGVSAHRGRIIAVVDVARLRSGRDWRDPEAGIVVVVGRDAPFGIRADAIEGVESAPAQAAAPGGEAEREDNPVIRGVTDRMVAIVDVEALIRDRRVRVDDEV